MIHLERTSLISDGKDTSKFSYEVHYIDAEDKLSQLIDLEQQLELTEKRFKNLQNYVEYIRTLYHGSIQDPSAIQICSVMPQDDLEQNYSFISVQDIKMDDGAGGDSPKKEKFRKKERRSSQSKRSSSRRRQRVLSRNESRSTRRSPSRESPRESPSRSLRGESTSCKSSRKAFHDEVMSTHSKHSNPRRYFYDDGVLKYRSYKKRYDDQKKYKKIQTKRILSDEDDSKILSSKGRPHNYKNSSKRLTEDTNQIKYQKSSGDEIIGDASFTSKVESNDSLKEKLVPHKSISRRTIESMPGSGEPDFQQRRTEKSVTSVKSLKKRSIISPSIQTYLKPTLSSQMKRKKSPVTSFNFRSIPFVAGKAITKSHNLGIKIQETLSIIKRNTLTEVNKRTGDNLAAPENMASASNSISRYRHRHKIYETKSRYHSRNTSITTSKPVTVRTCSTLSNASSCSFIDDLSDSAEMNIYLKKALMYIQADFTETLEEYKSLSKENKPDHADKIKELEYKLDRKEEVIKAFSKLYAQVAELRKRLEQISSHKRRQNASRGSTGVSSCYPAVKLTRLLRKIQDFQTKMQDFQEVR